MTEHGKDRAVAIFASIFLVMIAVITLTGLYQAGQAGLLTPGWWSEITRH